jgi:molybdate transport system ATP-binding protein
MASDVIQVRIDKRLGDFRLSADFATDARAIAFFGPSGSGKTSLVNMIAGLLTPDTGEIRLGDTLLFDAARRIDTAPHRRRIGTVFQDGRLFPHLSVQANLHYGRVMRGLPDDPDETARLLAMLDLGALLKRRPASLSGGERQRVAIGRALLMGPRLLMLDEPLASLDEARKAEIMPYLERLRDEVRVPLIYVSHDRGEIARIATAVVRFADGHATLGD